MLTIYDSDGNYGHPDHIQVHRVGLRAAELAGTARVFEGTINRDHIKRAMLAAAEAGELPGEDAPTPDDFETFGRPESMITTTVDVREFIEQKRASMAAHASQIADSSFFLAMPPEQFEAGFGQEWFIRHGVPEDHRDDDLFAGIELVARPLDAHGAGAAARVRRGVARPASRGAQGHRGAPGHARHDGGPARVARWRAGRAPARPQPRDHLRRGGVACPGAARAAGRAPGSPRCGGRGGELRRGLVRRPRQGRVLLPGAGGRHARCRSPRPARAPARQHPHHLLRGRAHPVLRHDGSGHPAEARRRGSDLVTGRRDLRPRAHRVHPTARAGRDRDERPGALRGGGLLAAPHAGGGGHRVGRGSHDPLVPARRGRRPPQRPSLAPPCSRAPRWPAAACSTPAWACTTGSRSWSAGAPASRTASPTPSSSRTRSPSTPRRCPRRWAASPPRSAPRPPAAVDALRAGIGLPGRLSEVGVAEDDLDAVARLSQSNANVGRNPRPVSEDDARAILQAAY